MSAPIRKVSVDALRSLVSPRPKPVASHRPSSGPASNVDRLVDAALELMRRFGGAAYSSLVADAIRKNVNEAGGADALARLHDLTRPPYR